MRVIHLIVPAAAAAGFLAASTCRGQCSPKEVQTLTAPDGAKGDQFGWSVALSGDTAIIGAPHGTYERPDLGAAYVYVREGGLWSLQARLEGADEQIIDHVGGSVAIDGDTAVVGAPEARPGGVFEAGAVYVFARSGGPWSEELKLTAPDGDALRAFGSAVAIDGDTMVIGAEQDTYQGSSSYGSAYVFEREGDTWTFRQKIVPAIRTQDLFGHSVSISGDSVAIGAPRAGDGNAGRVYVFVRDAGQWTERAALAAPDWHTGDSLGTSVVIEGDTVVGGAPYDQEGGQPHMGSMHVFERAEGVWTHVAEISAPDEAADDTFGAAVALWGDVALAGVPYDDAPEVDRGSAMPATRIGGVWTGQDKFTASGGAKTDHFGAAVVLGDGVAIIGAPKGPNRPGSVYVFDLNCGEPCYADCDGVGGLDLFDFLCFVNQFNAQDAKADCDGNQLLDLFDFLCFTNGFNAGC